MLTLAYHIYLFQKESLKNVIISTIFNASNHSVNESFHLFEVNYNQGLYYINILDLKLHAML